MASVYPGALDNHSTAHVDAVGEPIHNSTINDLADAVNKLEVAVGINPFKGGRVFDAKDYGAVFDFVYPTGTDNTAAIQAAINAAALYAGGAPGQPGSIVQLPAGSSQVFGSLTVKKGVWLRGHGPGTTVLYRAGTANTQASPMIVVDATNHMAKVSDLSMSDQTGQAATAFGIHLMQGTQALGVLGGSVASIERVVMADMKSYAVKVQGQEQRIKDVYARSSTGAPGVFFDAGSDNLWSNCTADTCVGGVGFNLTGGNHKLTNCKAFGMTGAAGVGFYLAGAGRHMLSSCEAQDNEVGFTISGSHCVLSSCLSDTSNRAGFEITGDHNNIQATVMYGGGGTGAVTQTGFLFREGAEGNNVRGVSGATVPVGGVTVGQTIDVSSQYGGKHAVVAYAATVTPDPYLAEVQEIVLTGNITIASPLYKHAGQRLTFMFLQDGTGTRTVTFNGLFRASWTPDTTAGKLNIITFEYTGSFWRQVSAVTGLTAGTQTIADTFTRANGALGTSSSGHTWITAGVAPVINTNQAAGGGAGNGYGVIDAGVIDYTVQFTVGAAWGAGSAIVWRYVDTSNYMSWQSGNAYKKVAGVDTNLNPPAASPPGISPGDILKVVVSGATYMLYKNGALAIVGSDSSLLAGTKAGFQMQAATDRLDDFSIL